MRPLRLAVALSAASLAMLAMSRPRAAVQGQASVDFAPQDMSPGWWPDAPTWEESAGIAPQDMPAMHADSEARNVGAFLEAIKFAEGTAKAGGYGALFGWPRAGRSFDPNAAQDHPRQFFDYTDLAGNSLKTSAAGAYQITYTTWRDERVRFLAWAALNGYSTAGFLPSTQDAFAVYLLHRDGALDHVKAGRLAQAVAIARRRWASLPGAGVNQPERTYAAVAKAYADAGGTIA